MGGKGSGQRPRVDWARVDWSLSGAEIARRLGVRREAVRQARARLRARSPAPAAGATFRAYVAAHRPELAGLTVEQAVAASGVAVSRCSAAEVLRRAGVLVRRRGAGLRHKLEAADWRLPNADLARIWGAAAQTVANHRSECGKPSARWDVRDPGRLRDPQYLAALAAERARAGGQDPGPASGFS